MTTRGGRSLGAVVVALLFATPACGRTGLLDLGAAPADLATPIEFDLAGPDLYVPTDECADGPRRLFVVDDNLRLSRFRPDTLQFTDVGTLACPAQSGATPFSMAVEQSGQAWVVYSSGELFVVDTTNANCQATVFAPAPTSDPFFTFGMSFVPVAPSSAAESLFVAGEGSNVTPGKLGRINLNNLILSKIAPFTGAGSPELSGSPDGSLWAFFPIETMPRVSRIDQTSGAELDVQMIPELRATLGNQNRAWAFAWWGGDFWIFLARQSDTSSKVYHLAAGGQFETALPYTGRTIVGAGVSTCKRVN